MLKTWTLCEKTGEVVVDADASKPSRSLRSDMRMIESSLEGGGGVDGIPPATCFVGDEDARFGGDGVNGRLEPGARATTGGFRAGADDADGVSFSDSEANAASRSFE